MHLRISCSEFLHKKTSCMFTSNLFAATTYSEKFFHSNFSCFAKSYNRSFSTINMIGRAIDFFILYRRKWRNQWKDPRPLHKYSWLSFRSLFCIYPKVSVDGRKRFQQQISIDADTDYDLWMKRLHDWFTNALTRFVSADIQLQKYLFVFIQELNITKCNIKTSALLSVFPTGDYKLIFNFQDSNEEKISINTIIECCVIWSTYIWLNYFGLIAQMNKILNRSFENYCKARIGFTSWSLLKS